MDEQELVSEARVVSLAVGQIRVLELIASGAPLSETLDALLIFLERDVPEMLCSLLLLDEGGQHLRHGSAPSLPPAYCRAIDGAPIGPRAGSCGTAAYLRRQVVVTDIDADPLWTDYWQLAREHGLRACWSTPIRGSQGEPRALSPAESGNERCGLGLGRQDEQLVVE
jgi:GAF domain-containing protein